MTFLAPAFLLLAGAALVPLLIHLIRRRAGKRVDFPAARYLVRAEQENSRKLKLRNLLLMLLRVAAVLLLALAASRPIGAVVGVGHAPMALAIVVDNSLSSSVIVDGRPLLDMLRDAALNVAEDASPSDNLWLVTADAQATGGSHGVVANAIRQIDPLGGSGQLSLAFARAIALLESSRIPNKRIAILSDGQLFEWQGVENFDFDGEQVSLFVPVVDFPANRSVVSVLGRPTRWTPGGELLARLSATDSTTFRIDIAGRALARGTAAPAEEIVVRATPAERGWLSGLIEIEPDEFRADDRRHFALWIGSPPSVSAAASAGTFLGAGIDALLQGGTLQSGSGITVAAAEDVSTLPALIVPPADPVRIGAANRALERLGIGWRYGALDSGTAAVQQSAEISWDDDAVTVSRWYPLTGQGSGATDTLATVDGTPWLVAGDRYVLLGSPLSPDATNLPLRASFLPLLAQLITQHASGDRGGLLAAFPGATIARPSWADALIDRDSLQRPLSGATFRAPDIPGVYQLYRGAREVGALVVNPPAGEYEFSRQSDANLRAHFSGADVSVFADQDRWARAVFQSAGRRPLVLPFLLLTLAVLIAESIVSRDRVAPRS